MKFLKVKYSKSILPFVFAAPLCAFALTVHAQVPDAQTADTISIPVTVEDQSTPSLPVIDFPPTGAAQIESTPIAAGPTLSDARIAASASARRMNLIETIATVIDKYPQRDAALAALRAAEARVRLARSQGGLQVGLSGSQNLERTFGESNSGNFGGGGGGGGFGGGSQSSTREILGFESTRSLGINADLPLFSGGRISAGKRNAGALARAQAAQTLQISQDLVRASIETYLNILRGEQLLEVAQSNLNVSRERSRIANVRFFAGAAARLEVLRADATLADAAQQRVDASSSLAQFKSALNILMGRKPETPLSVEPIAILTPQIPIPQIVNISGSGLDASTLPGEVVPVSATILTNPNPSNDALYALAETNRPTGIAFREQIQAAEANVDVARAGRRPSLGLSLGGLLRNPTNFLGGFVLNLGLSIAQNLFDSGRTSSQVAEARALVDQSRANLELSRLQVANQIETELLNLDAAQKRARLSQIGVVAAQEALRAAQLGYAAGAQTSLAVSDAQAALLLAQQQAVNARFEVANAQSNLSAAVGILTVEGQRGYELALQQEMKDAKKLKK